MKKVRVEEAIGMELCHDITAMYDGFKGAAFKRGHVIQKEDIPKLLDYGKKTVFVWEPEAGEIHEEDCARRMAAMAPVEGAHYTGPSEGKVLLMADQKGMFRVDTELLREINMIGDITICTAPDHYRAEPGMRLASMRIVPLVTKEEQIIRAEELCKSKAASGGQLLKLLPYRALKAGVVITGSEVYEGRIKDKFEPVIREKLKYYPGEIIGVTICDDDLDMIMSAARTHIENGADLLIFTGGMSVDPDDLTPTAIRELGAELISYGVPSQPGNMSLVAYLKRGAANAFVPDHGAGAACDDIAILGVPGAAISLPTTMLDVLLPQIYTGVRFTKEDLVRLGDGGLCMQCKTCHYPCCTFGRY
ncbi:MAG: molybdopterin-binding protein [Eubacteriales bacterium]|nr:molybdopterin-binding protein [Eubacteriales bacterium]